MFSGSREFFREFGPLPLELAVVVEDDRRDDEAAAVAALILFCLIKGPLGKGGFVIPLDEGCCVTFALLAADRRADLGFERCLACLSMENKMDSFSFLFLFFRKIGKKKREEKKEIGKDVQAMHKYK